MSAAVLKVHHARQKDAQRETRAIDPNSRFFWLWNFLILCLVIESALSVPFKLAFEVTGTRWLLCLIEVIFVADICVGFRTGYVDEHSGSVIRDAALIRNRYLRGFFWVDLIASLPIELVSLALGQQHNDLGQQSQVDPSVTLA